MAFFQPTETLSKSQIAGGWGQPPGPLPALHKAEEQRELGLQPKLPFLLLLCRQGQGLSQEKTKGFL